MTPNNYEMDNHINNTNRFHVVVGLFRDTSQKTLKCGKALFRSNHNHYNSSNVIGAPAALFFINHSVEL